mmetsp:Transcript_9983/g.31443  ORF Transcript_9983/g.31443 Transcript_9983/m.31443 type:complete len:276 (-) Transcript_9983:1745-2572(-)
MRSMHPAGNRWTRSTPFAPLRHPPLHVHALRQSRPSLRLPAWCSCASAELGVQLRQKRHLHRQLRLATAPRVGPRVSARMPTRFGRFFHIGAPPATPRAPPDPARDPRPDTTHTERTAAAPAQATPTTSRPAATAPSAATAAQRPTWHGGPTSATSSGARRRTLCPSAPREPAPRSCAPRTPHRAPTERAPMLRSSTAAPAVVRTDQRACGTRTRLPPRAREPRYHLAMANTPPQPAVDLQTGGWAPGSKAHLHPRPPPSQLPAGTAAQSAPAGQ